MKTDAYRTLRISLAAAAMLLLSHVIFPPHLEASRRGEVSYTVVRGDTLHRIAKKFQTTVPGLKAANRLKSSRSLKPGQVLVIPTGNSPQTNEPTTFGIVRRDRLEVRSESELIAVVHKNDKFVILSRDDDKFNIRLGDGRTGFVPAEGVDIEETRKPLPVNDRWSVRGNIVRSALACRGARYRRGGESSRGFDCSGLTKYVYALQGIKLPHSSRDQFRHGKPVEKPSLQAGDLVFFKNTYRRGISHVGIYMGDGKFIHASTRRRGVCVDDLDSAYFRRKYAGARRL